MHRGAVVMGLAFAAPFGYNDIDNYKFSYLCEPIKQLKINFTPCGTQYQ